MRVGAWLALALIAAPSAAGFLTSLDYSLEVFSHFRTQYCAGAFATGAGFYLLKANRGAAIATALGLVNGVALFVPLMGAAPHGSGSETSRVRVVWANLEYSPDALAAIAALAAEVNADVVALTELPNGDTRWAKEALRQYPGSVSAADISVFSISLHAREPFATGGAIADTPPGWSHAARWAQTVDGTRVVALHPTPPINGAALIARDAVIRAAARKAAETPASLLVGDFNATPWSRVMIDLKKLELRRVDCGAPWTSTWQSKLPLAGLPIDHAYVERGVHGATCRVGPDVGSDHYPLIIDLVLD